MTQTLPVAPWRLFTVEVGAVRRLSPSFVRVTFTGPDLHRFADNGYDQRIKLAFPLPGERGARLPEGPDWYPRWRALPERDRNPIRTYTVRLVRPERSEVDVDLVLHGDGGPATRWARRARPGDGIVMLGPDAGFDGDHGGVEFRPQGAGKLLLAGDETAAPAICAILDRLPATARGRALLEVPEADDVLPTAAPPGVAVSWFARGGDAHGARLVPAVSAAAADLLSGAPGRAGEQVVDVDTEILWEVPATTAPVPVYTWLAGEAGVIRTLRRHLVGKCGVDRRAVAFMGYWRLGRADPA
ncbi:siderophore-interacting protein [Micromonospora sp. WMMA1363]|uniref:siderophore-interacting protein n=1 Tax=Micromonospora sp. WMMA1363 TaxID=3053985 RepID=UPI00259C7674|nr:siderophore-interacting protein [Micromonospora sp. WMMA1363]MDM4719246.1 siderophore-interacting protein [Micromonospora sp. WMMA1363]